MTPRARREDAFCLCTAPIGGATEEPLRNEMMLGCVASSRNIGACVGVTRSVKQTATDCTVLGHGEMANEAVEKVVEG